MIAKFVVMVTVYWYKSCFSFLLKAPGASAACVWCFCRTSVLINNMRYGVSECWSCAPGQQENNSNLLETWIAFAQLGKVLRQQAYIFTEIPHTHKCIKQRHNYCALNLSLTWVFSCSDFQNLSLLQPMRDSVACSSSLWAESAWRPQTYTWLENTEAWTPTWATVCAENEPAISISVFWANRGRSAHTARLRDFSFKKVKKHTAY